MDSFVVGVVGLSLAVAGNIGAFAYCYGKLSQKVDDLSRRIERLEKIINGKKGG